MSLVERHDTMGQDTTAWDGGMGSVGDYVALLKPRVMSLVIFTAFVGLMLAPGSVHPILGAVAILCIAHVVRGGPACTGTGLTVAQPILVVLVKLIPILLDDGFHQRHIPSLRCRTSQLP